MCFVKKIFPILKDELKEGWDGCTPEKLCILLAIERMFKVLFCNSTFVNHSRA